MNFNNPDPRLEKQHSHRLNDRRRTEAISRLARTSAAKLTNAERALLKLILEYNSSYAAIAAAAGLSKSTVCRRYQRILNKLQTTEAPPEATCNQTDRTIRRLYVKGDLSQTKIAARLNITRYRVRQALIRTATPTRRKIVQSK